MTLSFSNLNEIGNLYENIAASDQEQLNEGAADAGVATRKAIGNVAKGAVSGVKAAGDLTGAYYQGFAGQKTTSKDPIARASNAVTRAVSSPVRDAGNFVKGLVTGQGDKASPAKYKSSSDGKMYANYNDALAARNSRLKAAASTTPTTPAARTTPAPTGAPAKPASSTATPAKTLPSKPAVPTGTTAGGTTFQRRAATGAELRAAQAARAAGKGEEGAIKASVAASKPAAPTVPARNGFGASTASMAAKSSVGSATAPAKLGSEVAATNKAAAAPSTGTTPLKPAGAPPTPTQKTSGAPLRKDPLWEGVDVYDLVLEYLLDNGHVDTVEEANYVMMEMDAETIGNIVEGYKDLPVGKMIRKAGVKQFKHGMTVGSGASSNPKVAQQVGKMGAIASLHDPKKEQTKSKYKG